ncbi:MAG: propanediol utilization protein [Chloroflexi bacterium]|nr:propanediol utilization protein [Chloroflexota bacterium]
MPPYLSHDSLVKGVESPKPTISAPRPPATPLFKAEPALVLFEFSSIARGMVAADAMVKRSAVELIHAGTVQPGRYLVLLGGEVAEVEEAMKAGKSVGGTAVEDVIWLPGIHPDVMVALHPASQAPHTAYTDTDALGIVETRTAPAAIHAGDIAVKGAQIQLLSIRVSDGLGGKGLVLLTGLVSDVEAALELVRNRLDSLTLLHSEVISQLHPDFVQNIVGQTRFFR